MDTLIKVKNKVYEVLGEDNSGHGIQHIERVVKNARKFAENEKADVFVTTLIALLHDVDDYKLVGFENAENLSNARRIMSECEISEDIQAVVLGGINNMGYSKRLKGTMPQTLEGMCVSDADMCDAMGMVGVIRTAQYQFAHGSPFFDRESFPIDNLTAKDYTRKNSTSAVCHMFEKILKLKKLMLTNSGKAEAEQRHNSTVNFLIQYFKEENANDWLKYLDNFLAKEYNN